MSEARSERRAARRAQRGLQGDPQTSPPSGQVSARPQPRQPAAAARRSNFVVDAWAELKKVEWPGQNQVIQGTVVVLIACLVVGTYLYVNDQVWKHVVSKVFLGH